MRVFILAGEPSGDKLGGALMAGLKVLRPDVTFEGIGGPMMMAEGLDSRFDMSELSVMGLAEILPKYRALKARINETAAAVIAMQPDVLITIDSPDFSLRVARQVKEKSAIRSVHYVAPTVWAWRPGRAEKMARFVDQVLALLPFEPPYMEAAGMRCDFVGHPVVAEPVASTTEAAAFRARHGLGNAPLLLVLPGSRQSEVARLGPVFQQVVARLVRDRPEIRVVIPAAAPVVGAIRRLVQNWSVPPVVLNPLDRDVADPLAEKRAAFLAADVALAASGTVSLELAASATPMVIAYDMNWISRQVIGRMVKVDTVTLVNLVSDTRAVPEFVGANCRPGPIAQAVLGVLDAPEAQKEAMALSMQRLGQGGEAPGLRAARAVLDGLSEN
ncbi:lipid-A-disaccharide synthase [Sulfitobacter sp. M57]|uniref:lipid-A-disaccharide synthase n=1 Tax=unclassified Sulfitobacter TaxID=196795 RepID=UPI0023E1EFB1|nr:MULTISPECIES: lipid-A-disaccharide synthase [unclassified Sulfitobacter]MDF3413652.1 lipid-A-disaccharide synthase [Sulfitobacter sp. KE5]MDF3421067.1 lipid-A-disaccharide synthase [Sulfitobacter sp. KE43]MDF3432198.1 lipid-A-disaccharide synthase [Sulfitobacter sp. KE42]MDF3457837.1 lipid-A-disaccharide synthase [Sulfitobacter sp. S74]MDF3461738.1 lipid-A-disaccharide synthase [Sulfitobacter sp. Ks18]